VPQCTRAWPGRLDRRPWRRASPGPRGLKSPGPLANSCKCPLFANGTSPTRPAPSATRVTLLPFSRAGPAPPLRTFGAARRPRRRRHRGRPDAGHFLAPPSPSPRRPARSSRRAGVMGRVEHPAGSLRPPRSHRALAPDATLTACGCPRTLAQYREPRAPTPRSQKAHLPQRLCRATLERQDPAPLQSDRPGVQRPAPIEERSPRGGRRSAQRLERRRQGPARPAPAASRGRCLAASEKPGGGATVAARLPAARPAAAGSPFAADAGGRLRGAGRSRARLPRARAARSSPLADRRRASRDPAESGRPSARRPAHRGSRGRNTRPTPCRRDAA
jgi:hypothetical protein